MLSNIIPKNAKRIHKGIIFDVFQWRQKLFDGSFKTFEAVRRMPSVIILATAGDKIVVLKEKQPGHPWFYSTPSGRIERGEKPRAAALRELLEETGLKPKKLILYTVDPGMPKLDYKQYVFIARDCRQVQAQNLDAGEKIKIMYYKYEEFLKLVGTPNAFFYPMEYRFFRAKYDPREAKRLKKAIFG